METSGDNGDMATSSDRDTSSPLIIVIYGVSSKMFVLLWLYQCLWIHVMSLPREVFHYTWRALQMSFHYILFSQMELAPWYHDILCARNRWQLCIYAIYEIRNTTSNAVPVTTEINSHIMNFQKNRRYVNLALEQWTEFKTVDICTEIYQDNMASHATPFQE